MITGAKTKILPEYLGFQVKVALKLRDCATGALHLLIRGNAVKKMT